MARAQRLPAGVQEDDRGLLVSPASATVSGERRRRRTGSRTWVDDRDQSRSTQTYLEAGPSAAGPHLVTYATAARRAPLLSRRFGQDGRGRQRRPPSRRPKPPRSRSPQRLMSVRTAAAAGMPNRPSMSQTPRSLRNALIVRRDGGRPRWQPASGSTGRSRQSPVPRGRWRTNCGTGWGSPRTARSSRSNDQSRCQRAARTRTSSRSRERSGDTRLIALSQACVPLRRQSSGVRRDSPLDEERICESCQDNDDTDGEEARPPASRERQTEEPGRECEGSTPRKGDCQGKRQNDRCPEQQQP